MSEMLSAFHFLRPWWLLALAPAAFLAVACLRGQAATGAWSRVIDPELLTALLLPDNRRRSALPFWLLLSGWTLAVTGLAGPTWERLPEPVHRRGDALVVAMDLSSSMLAADLSPSRLARARFKLNDLLATRRDAYTALIAYAGDAHVVTPLSDDTGTLAAMLPALDPGIMPVPGNDPVAALQLAMELLRGAGMREGRVLLLTDALTDEEARTIGTMLAGSGISLAVLAVGTREGAPVPLEGGGFARDANGGIAIPKVDVDAMRAAAARAGGSFHEISVDDADLRSLLPDGPAPLAGPREKETRTYDQWRDLAPWVALFLLPLASLGMRRGWLLLLPLCLSLPAHRAEAVEWQDLWLRKDQQGAAALASGDAARAAQLFTDPAWKGSAQFEAKEWAAAAESFARAEGPDADYNRGNALARAGKLEDALAAYDAALADSPDMEDAQANRRLVEDLLRQQKANHGNPPPSSPPSDSKDKQQQQSGQGQQNRSDTSQNQDTNSESGDSGSSDGSGKPEDPSGQDASKADESAPPENAGTPEKSGKSDANAPPQGTSPRSDHGDEGSRKREATRGETDGKANEEAQAVEQWLRQVPDDPGALLRRKFEFESARRTRGDEE